MRILIILYGFACAFGIAAAPAQETSGVSAPPAAQNSQAPPADTNQAPEKLHVIVGHSALVHTPVRVKRILTGNPTVLETVMASPTDLVLTGKQAGGSSLLFWLETGQCRQMDVSADLDVGSLRNAVEQTYPGSGVGVESDEGRIMVLGTVPSPAVADQILKMAGNFSKDVVNGLQIAFPPRQKQVSLKVRFAEADRAKITAFGINLFSTGATNTIGTISTQQFGAQSLGNNNQGQAGGTTPLTQFTISDLLNIFLFRPDLNLGATIKDLQQRQVLQILAEPNLLALSGQPAHFLAGGEFPYPVLQGSSGGAFSGITIQFRPYGVRLEFTGTIEDDDTIRLKVAPEVSSLDYTNSVTISGFVMPAIQTRRAETEIELKDGQTFGIAGLLDERTIVQLSKVPGIADIPILGQLFRSRNINKTDTELIVLVTPSIVDPLTGQGQPAGVEVNMPVQNLSPSEFDKGLPTPSKGPGEK